MKKSRIDQWNEHRKDWIRYLQNLSKFYQSENDKGKGSMIKFERQIRVLHELSLGLFINKNILEALIDPDIILNQTTMVDTPIDWVQSLDSEQERAVRKALHSPILSLTQGPPGTGKTTIITEVCIQMLRRMPEARILVCSETHVAVDNILEQLLDLAPWIKVMRVTNDPAKVSADEAVQSALTSQILSEYFTKLKDSGTIDSTLIEGIQYDFNRHPRRVERDLFRSFPVLAMTCNQLAAYDFGPDSPGFDLVIIDESCKATFPEIIIPLIVAHRALIVGDPQQLPPTFCKEDIEVLEGLGLKHMIRTGFLDRYFEEIPESCKSFLNRQYRMTDEIGTVVSECFYGGKLLNASGRSDPDSIKWLDYSTNNLYPDPRSSEPLLENPVEVDLIIKVLCEMQDRAEQGTNVAIITPYKAQRRLLERKINKLHLHRYNIEINTINAIQGKDADFVFFSVTRNNGSMRFFGDPRLLNVALSRAKKKLWIVGNGHFLCSHSVFKRLYEAISKTNQCK
ncbi:MAG: AAA family ATPase [Oligoflexia bacterium]|nr:AAA family ATPase [Oligoflexia bacterium]